MFFETGIVGDWSIFWWQSETNGKTHSQSFSVLKLLLCCLVFECLKAKSNLSSRKRVNQLRRQRAQLIRYRLCRLRYRQRCRNGGIQRNPFDEPNHNFTILQLHVDQILWITDHRKNLQPRKDADDLTDELRWGSARPESRWKTASDARPEPQLDTTIDDSNATVWEECLTTSEHRFYMKYLNAYPSSCYSLNQDPDHTPMYARGKVHGICVSKTS